MFFEWTKDKRIAGNTKRRIGQPMHYFVQHRKQRSSCARWAQCVLMGTKRRQNFPAIGMPMHTVCVQITKLAQRDPISQRLAPRKPLGGLPRTQKRYGIARAQLLASGLEEDTFLSRKVENGHGTGSLLASEPQWVCTATAFRARRCRNTL